MLFYQFCVDIGDELLYNINIYHYVRRVVS